MKKTLIVSAVLATLSLSALAGEFVSASYSPAIKNKTTNQIVGDGVSLTLGTTALKFATIDGKIIDYRTRETGAVTSTAQARATFTLPVNQDLSVYGRAGVGQSLTAGNDYSFYTYAGGTTLKLYDNVDVFASAERNNSFKAGNPHSTAYEAGVGYNFTKRDTLSLSYERSLGDVNTSGAKLGYNHSF